MKKICLTLVGIYLLLLSAHSQFQPKDSSGYQSKPLTFEEANLVSSYYNQNGNHSAVTGGIGTEKVTDFANGLDVKFIGWDANKRKHTLTANLGIDHHSSASAAWVNKSGASKTGGTRIYPSLNWLVENEQKGRGFGLGLYYSSEYNYTSIGLDASISKKTKRNGEFTGKITGYFDQVKMITPSEFVSTINGNSSASGESKENIPSNPRNTLTGSIGFAQVFNKRLQGSVELDMVYQNGYLGLPFHRVYFNDGTEKIETLPGQRTKLPIGVRLNYFMGDKIIFRTYYRYYTDNWGIQSHTANLEVPVKITPFFSVSPFYRYYTQTAATYFAPYKMASASSQYFTSNYSYAAFNSQFFGMGFRMAPPKGITGILNSLELRYGHYTQTTDLISDVISVHLKFK
jgi:hypothetical protein